MSKARDVSNKIYNKLNLLGANLGNVCIPIIEEIIQKEYSELEHEKAVMIEENKKMYDLLNSIAHRKGTKMIDAKQIRDVLRNIKQW